MIVAAEPPRLNTRHRASPRARRLLHEHGLRERDISDAGRIRSADVESVISRRDCTSVPPFDDDATQASHAGGTLVQSRRKETAAFMAVEVDYFGIERVRRSSTAPADDLPYVARAVVDALAAFPYLNAPAGDQTAVEGRPVHLGIVVHLEPDGAVVPIVADADSLRLPSLAERIAATTNAARAARASGRGPADAESTFTISCPAHGALLVAPPLTDRQVAALAIGQVRARPVAVEREPGEYVVAVHPVGTIGLSFDHGVIDEGYAARFLDRIRSGLETRDWAGEL